MNVRHERINTTK